MLRVTIILSGIPLIKNFSVVKKQMVQQVILFHFILLKGNLDLKCSQKFVNLKP